MSSFVAQFCYFAYLTFVIFVIFFKIYLRKAPFLLILSLLLPLYNLISPRFDTLSPHMHQTYKQTEQSSKPQGKSSHEKSLVVLGIMPQTAQTDLNKINSSIKDQIKLEGLTWGQSKQEEIAYGIKKLILGCVIEDKVSIDDVIEQIQKFDDVQAVDIVSFNKV